MKKLIYLFVLLITVSLNMHSTTYIVANSSNLSSYVKKAVAGDTVLVHQGTYAMSSQINITNDGTEDKMIVLMGYPGETMPVIDASNKASFCFQLEADYWHIYGLELKNATHSGIKINGGNHNLCEYLIIHDNANTGFQIGGGSSYNVIKNVDSYHNKDADNEDADGFAPKLDVGTDNYFYGCRSWENSDDGYDGYMRGTDRDIYTYYDHCIAYRNGYIENATGNGDGNGFKLGGYDKGYPRRHNVQCTFCLSVNNEHKGFDRNSNVGTITLYNCSAYNNGISSSDYNFAFPSGKSGTQADGHPITVKNCVSISDDGRDYQMSCTPYVVDHNTWQLDGCSASDFESVDTSQIIAARKSDGSLPDMTFMMLKKDSKLIDAGTDVGLDYSGVAPDLGWKEYVDPAGIGNASFEGLKISRTDGSITINSDKPFVQVAIYDMSGKLLTEHTGYSRSVNIPVPECPLYLVRIVVNGHSYGYKIK
jgi:hypothetical protein